MILRATSPLRTGWPVPVVTGGSLRDVAGLLAPHDGQPVADVRERPERWAALQLVTEAVRRDVPVLAWGSGAALLGRALGAPVHPVSAAWGVEWSALPRGAVLLGTAGIVPLHWSHGRATAWAGANLPAERQVEFLARLPAWSSRRPASPLEEVGGEMALRPVLADFYAHVRVDPLLGPVFAAHVRDWDAHLEHVTAFWVTMLGGEARWKGNLNGVHAPLGIGRAHLDRWLTLWRDAAQAHLPPAQAAVLIDRAQVMGERLGQAGARGPARQT